MSERLDFERCWLGKLNRCLARVAGDEVRAQVMAGSEGLSDGSSRQDVIDWSREAMERLEVLVEDESQRRAIMTGCACQYSKAALEPLREVYEATGDVDRVHGMLQEQFEAFLRETLTLEEPLVEEIVARGWGAAGVKRDDTIFATKIPKSGFLVEYMTETDPEKKRQIYCHCPRVRDALKSGTTIPSTYCYCGAGFYQGIWEEILQQPVEVELLESVLQGDQVCTIGVRLPAGDGGGTS
jgi:predicted hydrocarbon binding protein